MTIPKDLLDTLMKDYKNPEDLIGETGLLKQLTKQLLERAMQAEITDHLGYEKNAPSNNKAVGVNMDGLKEVLGIWTAETEGAKFWHQVVTELKNRGVKDIFVACVYNPEVFEEKWNGSQPTISKSWRNNWERITPLFSYPPDIRKAIYTTNAIESVNISLRKVTKNRGSFPNDESMIQLLYLALQNISKKWTMPIMAGTVMH